MIVAREAKAASLVIPWLRQNVSGNTGSMYSGEKISIGTYRFDMTDSDGNYGVAYRFFAGNPKDLKPVISFFGYPNWRSERGISLVSIKPVPMAWMDGVNGMFQRLGDERIDVGYIVYGLESTRRWAWTSEYYPKGDLAGRNVAINLPYFLEAITTTDLKRHGIGYISTSKKPKERRIVQLKRVGLNCESITKIDVWLASMGRGIRERLRQSDQGSADCREPAELNFQI